MSRTLLLLSESDIFCDVIDNGLLHLYLTTAETSRFTTKGKRNNILISYLKPMIKDKRYQPCKKDIKNLLLFARVVNSDLEAKLVELRDLSLRYASNATDAKQLFNLLTIIKREQGFPAFFLNGISDPKRVPNTIYIVQEHVENGFIDTGEQVAPVSLFLESDKVETLVDFINETGLFYAKTQQINNIIQQGHILLNPIN